MGVNFPAIGASEVSYGQHRPDENIPLILSLQHIGNLVLVVNMKNATRP